MTNIFVGNLSYDATEDDIRDAFAQHGEVSSVNVITDRDTGRPRGFAFVEMPNDAEAQTAIESLNQSEIRGRAVNVNVARPKADRPRRSGGGGGGGGGGGRGGYGGGGGGYGGGGGGGGGGRRGGGGGGRW